MQGNVKHTQWLLGFGSGVGWPNREIGAIGPRATATLVASPQVPVEIEGLVVSRECAEAFALNDLRIGRDCKTAGCGDVPLTPFAMKHEQLTELLYLRGAPMIDDGKDGRRAQLDDVVRPLAELGTVQISQQVSAIVTNHADRSLEFEGAFVVRSVDLYVHSLHGERRMATTPPATCEVCSTALEQLAQGVDWCGTCGSTYVERKLRPSAFALVAPDDRLAVVRKLVTESRGF